MLEKALAASPIGQVLVDRSLVGWAEIELEVVRDTADNAVIVCSIENIDPMGVHTGDSVTVAPVMTLTDQELQALRDAAIAVIRAVGVSTGGANVQFALDRATGEVVVIEMNPRVSRSSALASKATGFPIAKIAARLAVGYTLDELPNEITGVTPASFEPTLDYVAVKIPRFAFEKVPGASTELTTHMKSVGEVLALGRTFGEAFGKAMAGRELDVRPRSARRHRRGAGDRLRVPSWDRYDVILWALADGVDRGRGPRRRPASTPGSSPSSAPLAAGAGPRVGDLARGARRRPRCAAPAGPGLADRDIAAATGATRAAGRRAPPGPRRAADLPRGRHLRGRVRGADALLLRRLRGGGRAGPRRSRRRSSCSARARTGSGRASSSTTAASTRPRRPATSATRR